MGTRIESSGGTVRVLAGQDINILAAFDSTETSQSHQRSRFNLARLTSDRESSCRADFN